MTVRYEILSLLHRERNGLQTSTRFLFSPLAGETRLIRGHYIETNEEHGQSSEFYLDLSPLHTHARTHHSYVHTHTHTHKHMQSDYEGVIKPGATPTRATLQCH